MTYGFALKVSIKLISSLVLKTGFRKSEIKRSNQDIKDKKIQ